MGEAGYSVVDVEKLIDEFFRQVADGNIEIYNEFSLQHELGFFLRASTVPVQYKVQFERPVTFFGLSRSAFAKSEIDILLFTHDRTEQVAIEVKFPRNGQHPEQMFKFCQDIAFLEQLISAGFTDWLFRCCC
jgi:hypothetical protein